MGNVTIGLQLYSLHTLMNGENLPELLAQVRDMGYEGVEGFGDLTYDAKELKALLDKNDLKLLGWHTPMDRLDDRLIDSTIAYFEVLGVTNVVIPWLSNPPSGDEAAIQATWSDYAQAFARAQAKLRKHGMRLGYHNHQHEFNTLVDGKPVMQYFFDVLPEDVFMQLDTGNAMDGDGDIYATMQHNGARVKQLHLKPWGKAARFDAILGEEGDAHDWAQVHALAKGCGVEAYIVEFEAPDFMPPIEAVKRCIEGLKRTM